MASIWDVGNSPSPTQSAQSQGSPTPWYNPAGGYGQTQDWYNTPIGGAIREQDKALAFSSWLQRAGVSDNDNSFNRWAYSQAPRFNRGYGQATMDNPMISIDQYLATLPGYSQLKNEYNAQTPTTRGVQSANYSPVIRWLNS
jgi:hypothetical protein